MVIAIMKSEKWAKKEELKICSVIAPIGSVRTTIRNRSNQVLRHVIRAAEKRRETGQKR